MSDDGTRDYLTGQAESREAALKAMYASVDTDTPHEEYGDTDEVRDAISDYALSIQPKLLLEVWLSMGGPNVILSITADADDGFVREAVIDGTWGSTHVREEVHEATHPSLWRYASEVASLHVESHRAG